MITVPGATGNTGGRVVEMRRAAGEPVRALDGVDAALVLAPAAGR